MSVTASEQSTPDLDGSPRAAIAGESACFDFEYLVSARIISTLLSLLFYATFFWLAGMVMLEFLDLSGADERSRAVFWQSIVTLSLAFWFWGRGQLRRFYAISAGNGAIRLRRLREQVQIAPEKVQAIVGLGGLNVDGGEIVVWKHVVVLTAERRYWLDFGSDHHPTLYRVLRQMCPVCLGRTLSRSA